VKEGHSGSKKHMRSCHNPKIYSETRTLKIVVLRYLW